MPVFNINVRRNVGKVKIYVVRCSKTLIEDDTRKCFMSGGVIEASYWYDKAVEGLPAAQYGYSVCLQKGWGIEHNQEEAARNVCGSGTTEIPPLGFRRGDAIYNTANDELLL
eukprot:9484386-Pyramimonas_sp.AAC.1